jgi:hypothetical protein
MKYFLLLFCLFPIAASAVKIADCDNKPYDVTIVNGGAMHMAHLKPMGGSVEEWGPAVSFQLEGERPVVSANPYDEYCIWHGRINIQKRNPGNSGGGFGAR